MAGQVHTMSPAELQILEAGASDPNFFFDYWFRKPGQKQGWQLDYKFDEAGKWQEEMCMASQSFIVAIAGIATGKSVGVVMSAAFHATLTPTFKFLNVAKEGWQSKLMHKALLEQAKDTPFEKLIVSSPTRPYPVIQIAYKIGERKIESSLEFMSIGESGDATNIFSWRGDWLNIEEAGRIDNLNEIVGNLATRLTGVTAEGREFLARMSLISNPWDNIELWMLYDMALADKEDGLVFNIDTAANKNVTEKQVKLALKRIPEDQHERFMTGNRQQGRGNYFSPNDISKCESEVMSQGIIEAYKRRDPGYIVMHNPVLGVWHFRVPRQKGRLYFVVGDPGTGAAPSRNAPTILVFDVTDAPKHIPIVAMWWGNGGGSIMPFIDKLLEWKAYYVPLHTYVDNTGTQKNTAELINYDLYVADTEKKKQFQGLEGLDFASVRKYSYLMAARLSIEALAFQWPSFLKKSLSSQLGNYDPVADKNPNSKLPQDLVAVLCMGSYAVRKEYSYAFEETDEEADDDAPSTERARRSSSRDGRRGGAGRS